MQAFKNSSILFLAVLLSMTACKKDPPPTFELNEVELYPSGAGKTKLKSNEQFVAILFTNLFQSALSPNDIFDINNCIESIGDKELAREVIISNFMNDADVQLPSAEEMLADPDQFIEDTYVRFLVRRPNEAERTYLRNTIETDPYMTPELIYFSFALSNEYMYY